MTIHHQRCPLRLLLRIPLFVAAVIWLGVSPAFAQIQPCAGIQGSDYKILVDDIFDAAGGAASPLMQSLVFRVTTNLEQLKLESQLPIKVVRCAKRRPSDPSDFKKPQIEQLNASKVVLEIWGSTAQATDAQGQPVQEAIVGYLLVPVRFDEFTLGPPAGAFLTSKQAKSVTSVDELVKVVDQSGALAAYVAVSTGVKLLRAKEYDDARAQLCRADVLLERAIGPTPTGNDKALLAYVQKLAADVVTQAKNDTVRASNIKALGMNPGSCR